MNLVSERRGPRRAATVSASLVLVLIALFAVAGQARAAEVVYWDNYDNSTDTDSVSFAEITGGGGGTLNLGAGRLEGPEGMAYDTVTNRLFVTNEHGENGEILAINLDGSGAYLFTAPGAIIDEPEGITVDPATRMVYWVNTGTLDSIGWAKLDGSAGGLLSTTGATVDGPYKIALDPVGGRVYWANAGLTPDGISYANVNNTGGGDLAFTGGVTEISGLTVDPAASRIYVVDPNNDEIASIPLGGGAATEVNLTGATINEAYGLALDPSLGRLYLGNYGNGSEPTGAIGVVNLAGGGGGISPVTAPVNGPQDPVIIKSPTGAGAPTISRNPKNPSELTCSSGGWGADFPGGFVYQAPRAFAYQWTLNGSVLGSGPERITASSAGSYACTVTATNQAGSAAQTSSPVTVKATKVKLSTKKTGQGRAGKAVSFKVKAVNQGDISTRSSTKVCVKLPKASKADLKAPKCKKLGALKGRAKKTLTIKVKVKPGADEGPAKLTFQVKGAAGKAAKSKIVVK